MNGVGVYYVAARSGEPSFPGSLAGPVMMLGVLGLLWGAVRVVMNRRARRRR